MVVLHHRADQRRVGGVWQARAGEQRSGQLLNLALSWSTAAGERLPRVRWPLAGRLRGQRRLGRRGDAVQWTLSGLSYATTCWWQVQAVNTSGQTMADNGA